MFCLGYRPIFCNFFGLSRGDWRDRRVERHTQLPQHQPGRFVKGIVGAVAEDHAGFGELFGGLRHAVKQRDVPGLQIGAAHASNCACRLFSTAW